MPEREHPRGRQSAEEISDLAVRLHERVRDGGSLAVPADVAASLHPEDAAELEAILRVLAALDGPVPDLADPPPHLWGRIAAELGPETEAVAHDGPLQGEATGEDVAPDGVAPVRPIGSGPSAARGRWRRPPGSSSAAGPWVPPRAAATTSSAPPSWRP